MSSRPWRLDRPWAAVDPRIADVLRPGLGAVIEDVITAVGREVPAYARPGDDPIGSVLRQGVRVALERLMDLLGKPDEALGPAAEVYERIGSAEYLAQRPLQAVLAAYRVGALATWRGLSALSTGAGIDAVQTARLAEACFAYIDEISAVSAAGYAQEQSADAGRREVLRAELVEALIDPAGQSRVAAAAARLGWPLPQRLLVAVWSAAAAPPGLLAAGVGELMVAVLGEGQAMQVQQLERLNASLGTLGALGDAPDSYHRARALHRLRGRAGVPDRGLARAADHLPALLLAADDGLAEALVTDVLQPLSEMDEHRRAVMVDTAASWLLLGGSRNAVAAQLHVHPQTVAYRMESVRTVFADELASTSGRWRLLLALRAEQQRRPRP